MSGDGSVYKRQSLQPKEQKQPIYNCLMYESRGQSLQLSHDTPFHVHQIAGQLETFKKHLEEFASKHKNEIRKNPEFRNHFQQMCARIGVDPLACKSQVT